MACHAVRGGDDLVQLLRTGLLDERVQARQARALIPATLPGGPQLPRFEGCL